MKTKILTTIKKYNMICRGDRVVVGLSGGADSMCLLFVLNELKEELDFSLSAAHLNHCIRGQEADRDEMFVSEYCRNNGIKLDVLRLDIPSIAEKSSESIELCARKKRYEFFESLNADKIATAHSGSDRIETLLMNMSRGAGLNGLCSIPPVRDSIIRPLIDVTRTEIEKFCKENSVPYINDSSNFTDEYTRNKYRLNVLPELKRINPAFEINVLRCISSLNEENDFIDIIAQKEVNERMNPDGSLNLNGFNSLPQGLKSRVIISYLHANFCFDYETKHISFIIESIHSNFTFTLPGNRKISFDGINLAFARENTVSHKLEEFTLEKKDCYLSSRNADKFTIFVADALPAENNGIFFADADKICDKITIRARRSGDYFHLSGRHCSKTLKKLFNELKIPKENRDMIYVIADDNGVIFVDGIGVDSQRCISSHTKHFLIIKTECDKNE